MISSILMILIEIEYLTKLQQFTVISNESEGGDIRNAAGWKREW